MELPGKSLFIGGAILAVGIGSGMAVAQIPSQTGVISGCYVASSGALRIVDEGVACNVKKGEVALKWNQPGQPGTPGQTGAAGTAGKDGTNGKDGADGTAGKDGAALTGASLYRSTNSTNQRVAFNEWIYVSRCDAGDEVIGLDSWFRNFTPENVDIHRDTIDGRRAMVWIDISEQQNGSIHALCLDQTP